LFLGFTWTPEERKIQANQGKSIKSEKRREGVCSGQRNVKSRIFLHSLIVFDLFVNNFWWHLVDFSRGGKNREKLNESKKSGKVFHHFSFSQHNILWLDGMWMWVIFINFYVKMRRWESSQRKSISSVLYFGRILMMIMPKKSRRRRRIFSHFHLCFVVWNFPSNIFMLFIFVNVLQRKTNKEWEENFPSPFLHATHREFSNFPNFLSCSPHRKKFK
jgi:hypothetical protein